MDPEPRWSARPHLGEDRRTLTGRHGRLEPLADRHAAGLWQSFSGADAHLWDYLGYGPFPSEEAMRSWVVAAATTTDPAFYACVDPAGRPLGWAALLRIVPEHGVAEIGHLAFSPAMQRTPMSSEVSYLLLDAIFAAGYRRAEWKCDAANGPSRRAAARLGFTEEGTFRQHMVVKGRNRDTCWFSLLDREWPGVRSALTTWLGPSNFAASGEQLRSLGEIRYSAIDQTGGA